MNKRMHPVSAGLMVMSTLAILSGCATTAPAPKVEPSPMVKDRVVEVAESIDTQLRTLIRLEKGVVDVKNMPQHAVVTPKDVFDETVTIRWSGTAEGFVSALAKKIGYEFVPSKVRPSTDTIVNISVEDMQLKEVLKDVGLRLDKTADIKVSKAKKTISIIYK